MTKISAKIAPLFSSTFPLQFEMRAELNIGGIHLDPIALLYIIESVIFNFTPEYYVNDLLKIDK